MNIITVIPARMGSTRFPGKPLAKIHGIPMIGHVYFRSAQSQNSGIVYIATCDQEIADYAKNINAPCVMTSDQHERCSDRTAEAMLKIEKETGQKIDIVIMVQGDEPMITPEMLDKAVEPLFQDASLQIVNLMSDCETLEDFEDPNEVKVVVDQDSNAIYFSREPIPSRKKGVLNVPMYKQVCVIPFRRDALLEFNATAPTPLEIIESVDMLRLIENGKKVKMVYVRDQTYSVDTPEDLRLVIKKMALDKNIRSYADVCQTESV